MSRVRQEHLSPAVVAVAGWALPGVGYWLLRQRARALTIGITIIVVFILGILLAGIRVVEAPSLDGSGAILAKILNKPWFIGQVLFGPIAIVTAMLSPSFPSSHGRIQEIGILYTAVAGMLNLLAIIDSTYQASQKPGRE